MDVLLWLIAALVLLAVVVFVVGSALPQDHAASRTRTFKATPDAVWAAINDPAITPKGSPTTETTESVPSRLLVHRVVGESAFAGSWTFEIAPVPAGSTLTITENASVFNPVFRFVSRFVMGHYRSIDAFMSALADRFPE